MAEQTERINPFGIIWPAGSQYPEARAFLRMYGKNPYAQSALLATLLGLYANPNENWSPNSKLHPSPEENAKATDAIGATIVYIAQQFPEWREEGYELDSAFLMPPYTPEDRLVHLVDKIIEKHMDEKSDI